MKLEEFEYYLPPECISQKLMQPRDHSRLMVLDREKKRIHHDIFKNIGNYLHPDDLLVLNNTKVFPARIFGIKEKSGGKIEVLLLQPLNKMCWEVLVKPGRKIYEGIKLKFGEELQGTIKSRDRERGSFVIEFSFNGDFKEILKKIGKMPTPPYIKAELKEDNDYQTVYAIKEGSIAAPTAGFHFTKSLLKKIKALGIEIVYLTLHVGRGTFEAIRVSEIERYKMSPEFYFIPSRTANKINIAHQGKRRIISVGTSTTRALESAFNSERDEIRSGSQWSDLFIYPGYEFKVVKALLTNFHLPKSTPLLLASSFAGKDLILQAYKEAIAEKYRFYSFGDAMLII